MDLSHTEMVTEPQDLRVRSRVAASLWVMAVLAATGCHSSTLAASPVPSSSVSPPPPGVSQSSSATPSAAETKTAAPYTVVDLGHWKATCLNDAGVVAGQQEDGSICTWQDGHLTVIGKLEPVGAEDFSSSRATGINASGQVVGAGGSGGPLSMSGLESIHPLLYSQGKLSMLPQKKSGTDDGEGMAVAIEMGEATGINDRLQVVGVSYWRAFFWQDGTFTTLAPLSTRGQGNGTRATAINNHGEICGATTINAGKDGVAVHAVVWTVPTAPGRDLGTLPGLSQSYATAINEPGTIVGFSAAAASPDTRNATLDESEPSGWIWKAGKLKPLASDGAGKSTYPKAINDEDVIVGLCEDEPVSWKDDHVALLNSQIPAASGWVLQDALAINNHGQILVRGNFHDKQDEMALLTPQAK